MAGSPPNFHEMDSRSTCIQGVLKVKVKVKGHVIGALSWILGMSYSVIDGLVFVCTVVTLTFDLMNSISPRVARHTRKLQLCFKTKLEHPATDVRPRAS